MDDSIIQQIQQLNDWYTTPTGRCFLAVERAYLDKFLPTFFGYHLVQLGGVPDFALTAASPIPHHVQLAPVSGRQFAGDVILSQSDAVPLLPHSADVVLMPHWLELLSEPVQCLTEVAESLVLGGHVVISGFNAKSLLHLGEWLGFAKAFPKLAAWHTMRQVEKWLEDLGFTLEVSVSYFFRPVSRRAQRLQRTASIDMIGQFLCPRSGGGYLIIAQKRAQMVVGKMTQGQQRPLFVPAGRTAQTSRCDMGDA